MREGIVIVDADDHVMDRPHRCYQKYLPEQYARRAAFFPGPYCILYASDYPHGDSEWPHTVDTLMKRDDLNQGVKAKILDGNALSFYGVHRAEHRAALRGGR